jgi:hypothetical protein
MKLRKSKECRYLMGSGLVGIRIKKFVRMEVVRMEKFDWIEV